MDYDDCLDEEYDFQYSDETESEPDVDLENQYYNSKAMKHSDPNAALEGFKRVLELKADKCEWGFRALKQLVKLTCSLGLYDMMMEHYTELLTYIRGAVTRNYAEKSISNLLDHMSTVRRADLLEGIYESTLLALKESRNDRLWFKTNTKLAKLYFDMGDFRTLTKVLDELRTSCETDGTVDVLRKGTQLLEIYALEIQMYTAQKNNKKLKDLYEKSLRIKSGIPHPLIMGVVRECGGKMHLREGQFQEAHTDFLEAFKNYDESGNARRVSCLKYLVLTNMLLKSDINPFDLQETKPYENDPEIFVMTSLVRAYQNNNLTQFQNILKEHEAGIMDDPFVKERVEELLRNIRTEVLVKLIKPFTRVPLAYLAERLYISIKETEKLLVRTIVDGVIRGTIDGVDRVLVLPRVPQALVTQVASMERFTRSLQSFHGALRNAIAKT